MKNLYIKKLWEEEDVLFYIHFRDGEAIRQIEISPNETVYLSLNNPKMGNSMLYDQSLDDLELQDEDYISQAEFEKVWKENLAL